MHRGELHENIGKGDTSIPAHGVSNNVKTKVKMTYMHWVTEFICQT